MSLSDPIADMLTRIRNAARVRRQQVYVKANKVCQGVAQVLKDEGYITDFDRIEDAHQGLLRIQLKYTPEGDPVITSITRVSKPGCRVYRGKDELPRVMGGLGIAIVSTNLGLMSDRKCRQHNVGGELICTVS
ncbi:MAG TPA: 30S ribosomal protein S8 [Anaerohalosphaeraceae bacterium]|nr:30S ribosomal protein S8 [Anaerohalosphaeraceae bacterium]HOL31087.1 30S ribosomal protein S8 [Anaerohalosphaeraceae bacterium]HOM76176.1 30S ribosomal protein S8 [Anaerohalosphaeraceae bacterium]HPC64661.1 30S ribosomal protein S8 [Anaerohalosphaeraceae bacterium]HPO69787.1 30S ribosomal protein S8 [Anaerohalosphaeraceae bacterium]